MEEGLSITNRRRKLIFINIVISCVASSMLSTALTTALPSMSADLGVQVSTVQWVTAGYSLVMGITMPLTAFLITRFKTKRLYTAGILIFLAGLALSAAAPGFMVLMIGRVLQAFGSGILSAMGQVIILSIFPAERRGTAMGAYGLSISAAPVVAPTIGGILIDSVGWRMIFIVVIAVIMISLVFSVFAFDNVLPTEKARLDIPSFALSIFAFGGITLGVGNIGTYGFGSPMVLAPLVIGGVTMAVFVFRQLHMEKPLLELRTLKNRNFALAVISSMLLYLILMGSTVLFPLYVQNIKGYSATISGLVTLPGSLVSAICSLIAGRIYDKIGIKKLFITGGALLLISNICVATVSMQTSIWTVAAYNVIRNIACGCLLTTLVTWGVSGLHAKSTAHATALLNSFRTIAGAVGSAVFVSLMTTVSENSAAAYGSNAAIHGFNMAFAVMAVFAVVLLAIPVFFVRKERTHDTLSHSSGRL